MKTPEIAVGGVIIKDNQILLVKRRKPPGKGLWAIPGGRVRYGETVYNAVIREMAEETGLEVSPVRLVYVSEVMGDGFHYVILDYLCDVLGGEIKAGGDAEQVRWFSIDEVGGEVVDSTRRLIERIKRGVPLTVRNCDVEWVVIGKPKNHLHYRTLLKLRDGLVIVFQEATITGILRGFANVVLHPLREYLKLVCRRGDWKKGYADYQLIEGDPKEAKEILDTLYGREGLF